MKRKAFTALSAFVILMAIVEIVPGFDLFWAYTNYDYKTNSVRKFLADTDTADSLVNVNSCGTVPDFEFVADRISSQRKAALSDNTILIDTSTYRFLGSWTNYIPLPVKRFRATTYVKYDIYGKHNCGDLTFTTSGSGTYKTELNTWAFGFAPAKVLRQKAWTQLYERIKRDTVKEVKRKSKGQIAARVK